MRRKLCLGSSSLAGSGLCLLLLTEISTFFSSTSLVARSIGWTCLLSQASCFSAQLPSTCWCLPLAFIAWLFCLWLSHIHIHDEVWAFLPVSWTFKPSCATSLLEQTSRRMQLSFTQPTADIFYSSFSFIFLDEASTLTFSAAKLVQATFLQVPGALFSDFFKNFSVCCSSKKLFLPKGEIIR